MSQAKSPEQERSLLQLADCKFLVPERMSVGGLMNETGITQSFLDHPHPKVKEQPRMRRETNLPRLDVFVA